jgi:hypothetical protein
LVLAGWVLGVSLLIDINRMQNRKKVLDMLGENNTFNKNKPAGIYKG